jgi:hypothetical protein
MNGKLIAGGACLTAALAIVGAIGGALGLPAAYFATLPVLAAGFAGGWQTGFTALAAAAVAIAAALGIREAGVFLVAQGFPAAMIVWLSLQARKAPGNGAIEWYPPGRVLAWLACYGVVAFAVLTLGFTGEAANSSGLEAELADDLGHAVSAIAAGADPDRIKSVTAALAHFFPAIVLASWIMMMATNAVIGVRVAGRFFGARGRPEPEWKALSLPSWLMTATAAASFAALIGRGTTVGFVGGNAALTLCVPYGFLGFATAHVLSAKLAWRKLLLWGLYLATFLLGWPVLFVAALGFVEDWIGLRRRFAGERSGPEDETL